jgi:hypothetical protein
MSEERAPSGERGPDDEGGLTAPRLRVGKGGLDVLWLERRIAPEDLLVRGALGEAVKDVSHQHARPSGVQLTATYRRVARKVLPPLDRLSTSRKTDRKSLVVLQWADQEVA